MVGARLYQKKSQVYFFLLMYGILALAGGGLAARSFMLGEGASNAAGFMLIFGIGMFILTFMKGRRPQVSVFEDFLELTQSRAKQLVRYRNVTSVSRPDRKRLVVTLREDDGRKDIVIWLRELDPADVEKLEDFLRQRKGRG